MKKYLFIALAALGFAACAEKMDDNSPVQKGELEESYIAINLMAADVDTRAVTDDPYGDADEYGYDIFARLGSGARLSLTLSITAALVNLILGGVVQLGYAQYLLKQQDREINSVKDLFSQFDRFGQGFLQLFLQCF